MSRFYNKYLHTWQYAKCGVCPSCQQEKAFIRTQRIKNAVFNGYTCLFVTLTYRNIFVPYIRKNELYNNPSTINVYRDADTRRVRISSDYQMQYRYNRKTRVLQKISCYENNIFPDVSDISKLPKLRGQGDSNKVGVLYFKDAQDFEKRLRINLSRRYKITAPIYTAKVTEYGETYYRPHLHLLVYVPTAHLDECTRAIIEAWPYDSKKHLSRFVEVARNAASYVSAYVNRGSDFPSFLSLHPFRPKHSFSKGFGYQNSNFSLESILASLRRGNLEYPKAVSTSDGSGSLSFVPLPKYALNRYFFRFKGYSRLSHSELRELIACPQLLRTDKKYLELIGFLDCYDGRIPFSVASLVGKQEYKIDWSKVNDVIRSIELRYHRFISEFVYYENGLKCLGLPDNIYSRQLFADYYYDVWRTSSSNSYKRQFADIKDVNDLLQVYYNLDELDKFKVHSPDIALMLHRERQRRFISSDPNNFDKVVNTTMYYTKMFNDTLKRKKVTNSCMRAQGLHV